MIYSLLFAIQLSGAVSLIRDLLPSFREVLLNPGQQPSSSPFDDYAMLAVLLSMQAAYWYRVLRVPIPYRGQRVVLSHIFLFLGRLSFIFGASLFSVVAFRHLPKLGPDFDISVGAHRGISFGASLFALFCLTLEFERLGNAVADKRQL
jgi:hypothetical protein